MAVIYIFQSRLAELLSGSISVVAIVVIIVIAAGQWLISAFTPKWARFLLHPPARVGKAIFICVIGTVFIKFYQLFINPLYVAHGRLVKLDKPEHNMAARN